MREQRRRYQELQWQEEERHQQQQYERQQRIQEQRRRHEEGQRRIQETVARVPTVNTIGNPVGEDDNNDED